MTVEPLAAASPMRLAQPVVAALASAGVVTVTAQQLFGNTLIVPEVGPNMVMWLAATVAVVMVVVPAAAVAMRPSLGRAGGWPIVAAGLGLGALAIQTVLGGFPGMAAVVFIFAVIGGFAAALGGLVIVAASAPAAERIAVAAGVAFGFAGQRYNQSLLTFDSLGGAFAAMLPFYLVLGLAVAASAMAFNRRAALAAPGGGPAAVVPVLVVAGVCWMVQLGHYLRGLVAGEFRVSVDGLASPRRNDTVSAFSEYSAIGLAALAGLILVWLGYRRGKADLARWVALGFALGGPSLMVKSVFYYSGALEVTGFVVTALLATAAGVALALRADRLFAWDALGVALAAIGMIIGSATYRVGPPTSALAALLIIGGLAFALASGLTRVVRVIPAAPDKAVSLSLGFVAMLATSDAIAPVAWEPLGFRGFQLSLPIISLVGAGVVLALFGLRRGAVQTRIAGQNPGS